MREINVLQTIIMTRIKRWANEEKSPIPRKEIVEYMNKNGVGLETTKDAIEALIIKGYIRRAYGDQQKKTFYVMIRNI